MCGSSKKALETLLYPSMQVIFLPSQSSTYGSGTLVESDNIYSLASDIWTLTPIYSLPTPIPERARWILIFQSGPFALISYSLTLKNFVIKIGYWTFFSYLMRRWAWTKIIVSGHSVLEWEMNKFMVQGFRKGTSCVSQQKKCNEGALKVQFCMGNFTRQVEIGVNASKAHERGWCIV